MKTEDLDTKMIEALQRAFQEPQEREMKTIKTQIMNSIKEKQEVITNASLLEALKRDFIPASETGTIRIRNTVMASILEPAIPVRLLWHSFSFKMATSLALSFAIILTTQPLLKRTPAVTASEGFYVIARGSEEGTVLVDGKEIAAGSLVAAPGKSTVSGPANIVAPSKAVIRLENEKSKVTLLKRENEKELSVKLESGNLWGQSLTIPVRILGNNFSTNTQLGSTLIATDSLFTRIISTNITGVQVNQKDIQFISTKVFPNEQMLINNKSLYARKDNGLRRIAPELLIWINNNIQQDQFFAMKAKEVKLAQARESAGPLPGELLFTVDNWIQKGKSLFSINTTKGQIETTLQEAENDFAKAITLFEKGRDTIAQQYLQAFESKMLFASDIISDTVSDEQNSLANRIATFLDEKKQEVAAISNEDPLSVVKRRVRALELTITPKLGSTETALILTTRRASEHLTEAHQAAQNNQIDIAKEKLEDYLATQDTINKLVTETDNKEAINNIIKEHTEGLTILNNLQTIPELKTFAENLGEQTKENLSTLLSFTSNPQASTSISGTVQ